MPTLLDQARNAARSTIPEFATSGGATTLPTVPPSPPFLYAWHPAAWVVLAGQLVPRLSKRLLQPGVNNVSRDKDGRWHIGAMRTHAEARGWKLIELHHAPDGESYIHPVDVRYGVAHLGPFESAFPGTDVIRADLEGYAAWLQKLISDGVITPCPPYVAERLADEKRVQLGRLVDQLTDRNAKSHQPAIDAMEEEIRVLTEYAAAHREPKKTARPARKRRGIKPEVST